MSDARTTNSKHIGYEKVPYEPAARMTELSSEAFIDAVQSAQRKLDDLRASLNGEPFGGARLSIFATDLEALLLAACRAPTAVRTPIEDAVERVARVIDPQSWAIRDKDLTRRDEWERSMKVGWGDATFEEWCDRFIGKSLEQARAAITACRGR